MGTTQRSESFAGTSPGYHTAGSAAAAELETDEVGLASVIGETMRRVRKRTKLRVLLSLMVSRTEQRPDVEATTFGPT